MGANSAPCMGERDLGIHTAHHVHLLTAASSSSASYIRNNTNRSSPKYLPAAAMRRVFGGTSQNCGAPQTQTPGLGMFQASPSGFAAPTIHLAACVFTFGVTMAYTNTSTISARLHSGTPLQPGRTRTHLCISTSHDATIHSLREPCWI